MDMDLLISMFIDDELDMDEKIAFVRGVHDDGELKNVAVSLLEQEKRLRSDVVSHVPNLAAKAKPKFAFPRFFAGGLTTALATAVVVSLIFLMPSTAPVPIAPHRFVIYQPDAKRIDISGSFTGWGNIPMKPAGTSGYWAITLDVPQGEHRFSYIVDGDRQLTDPTIPGREQDDFGGSNSVLHVEVRT